MDTKTAAVVVFIAGMYHGCSRESGDLTNLNIAVIEASPPVLVSPANGRGIGVPSVVTLRWKAVPGFTSYVVEVSANDSTFRRIVFSAVVDTLRVFTSPLDPNKYYWHVKATRGGGESPWSSTWWFLRSSLP